MTNTHIRGTFVSLQAKKLSFSFSIKLCCRTMFGGLQLQLQSRSCRIGRKSIEPWYLPLSVCPNVQIHTVHIFLFHFIRQLDFDSSRFDHGKVLLHGQWLAELFFRLSCKASTDTTLRSIACLRAKKKTPNEGRRSEAWTPEHKHGTVDHSFLVVAPYR